MAVTLIHTPSVPRTRQNGRGEVAEILNKELCGAENVVGQLRWLHPGDRFQADALEATHQLLYLMEGEGVITLDGKDYEVVKGAGIYLGPTETAGIRQRGTSPLKLFHLIVPIKKELQLDS
ncbi:MAG TPA: cupin domain-containing protein [Gammaproteobacteria bacterium]